MTLIKLKFIDRFIDRHGRERVYFRRDRGPRIALPGRPGSPEFIAAYEQAAMGEAPEKGPKQRGAPGTFDRLSEILCFTRVLAFSALIAEDLSLGDREAD